MEANNPTSLRLFPFFLHSFLSLSPILQLPPPPLFLPFPHSHLSAFITHSYAIARKIAAGRHSAEESQGDRLRGRQCQAGPPGDGVARSKLPSERQGVLGLERGGGGGGCVCPAGSLAQMKSAVIGKYFTVVASFDSPCFSLVNGDIFSRRASAIVDTAVSPTCFNPIFS